MKLRKLQEKDATFMLEWMHDESVVEFMGANFAEKTLRDCKKFIEWAQNNDEDLHLAIVDDADEYMGTVSLKHINKEEKIAEFAITVRKKTMGKGYSAYGMKEILNMGIKELGLSKIYWCVSANNKRAVRFYDKNSYNRTVDVPDIIKKAYTEEQLSGFIWYVHE